MATENLNIDTAKANFLLAVIFILGFVLRIVGINFGLPDLYHADESIVVNHAMGYGSGDFNPHFFKIPPLISYLLFVIYGLYFLIGLVLRRFENIDAFINLFLTDPGSFYLLGRVIFGVILGTTTVYALYRFSKKFFSTIHALLSSFFLALCFLHVRDSHYTYVDIPLLFVMVISFCPILNVLVRGRTRDYLLFGFVFGTTVATKYNGVFIFVPFLIAHGLRVSSIKSAILSLNLYLSVLISIVTFFIFNPFAVIDSRFFLAELFGQSKSEIFLGFAHHFQYSLQGGLGFPILLAALCGIFFALTVGDRKRWVVLSFTLIYYVVLVIFSQPYDRYVLPLIPFLCFFAADGLIEICRRLHVSNFLLVLFAFILTVLPLCKVVVSDYLFLRKDVRTIARQWVEQNIPPNAKVALDIPFYMPRLKPNLEQLLQKREDVLRGKKIGNRAQSKRLDLLIRQAESNAQPHYELFFLKNDPNAEGFLFSKPSVPYELNDLKKMGINYVVITQVNPTYQQRFYEDLRREGDLLARFDPYKDGAIEWPMDRLPLTGGPFLWKDLMARNANGQPIKIYQLRQ